MTAERDHGFRVEPRGDTWTRITTGETASTDDVSHASVDDGTGNTLFRFIKMQMIHSQPDVPHDLGHEFNGLGEFRINGQLRDVDTSSIGSIGRIRVGGKIALAVIP